MSATHTPGPWSLEKNSNGVVIGGGAEQHTSIFSEAGFGVVAKVLYKKPEILGDSKTLAWHEFEANAKLIAAAPELLDALNGGLEYDPTPLDWVAALLSDYETLRKAATGAGIEQEDPDAEATMLYKVHVFINEARAAIAKATK